MTFQIVGGQWCYREPIAYNQFSGNVDSVGVQLLPPRVGVQLLPSPNMVYIAATRA